MKVLRYIEEIKNYKEVIRNEARKEEKALVTTLVNTAVGTQIRSL